uniref:CAP domain-containing protein (inferred by orthology to a zebrafish protein) n=1 Tax=Strongyloides venezuelensis TaxID=75913 RepID=A0A0K0EZN7_STRVS
MNFLLDIVLCAILIIYIAVIPLNANSYDSDDEKELLLVRKDSDKRNFTKKSNRRTERNSHSIISVRKPSLNNKIYSINLKLYLGTKKIYGSIHDTVWHGFYHTKFWANNYKDYRLRVIQEINLLRLMHNACYLVESSELNKLAQIYVVKMVNRNPSIKSTYKSYGIIKKVLTLEELTLTVSHWYYERDFYSFAFNSARFMAKHFAQMVWNSSTSIGAAVLRNNKLFYIVVFFYPKGNIEGQYGRNVFRKKISWRKVVQIYRTSPYS